MRAVFLHTARTVLASMPDATVIDRPGLGGYGAGLRAVAPLLPAVLAFGVSFGVLARAAGFDGSAAIAMSLTTFAGSAQFAVVSVLDAGGTAAAAIVAAVLLNARYGPMGCPRPRSSAAAGCGACSRPSCWSTRAGRCRSATAASTAAS